MPVATFDEDDTEPEAPDGFYSLGVFDPVEAERLLKQFEVAEVRFFIDIHEQRVFTSGRSGAGYLRKDSIEIFVKDEDEQKATKIFTADWKV